VRKSSIYLPDQLKGALAELAERSGRSEADLIRSAIERLVAIPADAAGPAVAEPAHPRPAVVGVGMGPGDPALVTDLARRTVAAADRVLVITTDVHSVGRSEMVVRAVAPAAKVQRVPYAIGADDAGRQASLAAVVTGALAGADAGELVAVAVLGDPSQWTIFPDLAAALRSARPGLLVEGVPGVTAYQALAARVATALGASGTALAVVDHLEDLDRRLAEPDACVVVYKASTDAEAVRAVADRHRRRGAIVGELTGLPGQRQVPLDDLADGPISYLSTVVFPATAPAPAAR
jgi:precorrin-2/cobalt-factor-2 C20-methyltransferase